MIKNITGVSGSRTAYYAAGEIENHDRGLILVSSIASAERLKNDLEFFFNGKVFVMPEYDSDTDLSFEARDCQTSNLTVKGLHALLGGERKVAVIAPVSAALRHYPVPERFMREKFILALGSVINPSELKKKILKMGYVNSDVTEAPGEFSSRGDIIDIFAPSNEYPVRIEFFDDEIDSVRTYDPLTQRSIENLESTEISPAVIFMPTDDERKSASSLVRKRYDEHVAELIEMGISPNIYAEYIDCFDIMTAYLWEYMENGVTVVCDPARITDKLSNSVKKEELYGVYETKTVVISPFPEKIKGVKRFDKVINTEGRQVAPFNGRLQLVADEIRKLHHADYMVHIISSDRERIKRLQEYFSLPDSNLDSDKIVYHIGTLADGMVIDDDKTCYITENDIFPGKHRYKKRKSRQNQGIIFSDLHKGDYVVHERHGIGRFEGIVQKNADGEIKDYLKIHYAGTDVLYIPTEQLDIIQRYIGNEGRAPGLSRLSGSEWKRTRDRAKKAIEAIAEELVKLYAEREMMRGYAFSEDTVWQTEFEDDFPYMETEDQLKAIDEIKHDMQQPLPMDRLLCGDVGYGKTEVAARAIFKCISEGKQAVLLAPTTLLVNQHYHTLLERFEKFPFKIDMLSRFRTEKEQKSILKELANGTLDLVIGTHRLLSDDVKFKDAGLLVIDEEQRFGVKHKERIKMLKSNIDVLTLSATPIPRTLNMSLTGIKDISMIEEPPQDRYPVQTYVAAEDSQIIVSALNREIARGGQAFVVSSRIKGINRIADKISELVPQAVIGIGHGRMDERNLEDVMLDFVEGRINVLVATTIIENGIDIPNANTIIVLDADKFGLSQLYQLRGRVGRSNRLAYAYLTYKHADFLTDVARKRLAAIREFTEFGAGFKIAMRDLELRGAGNVLGDAQHGHIDDIGYELYCKEIDRAVRRLKGEKLVDAVSEVTVDIKVQAMIPNTYISNEALRLQAYKKIAHVTSAAESADVIDELTDRYGEPPLPVLNLISVAEIRSSAERSGICEISDKGSRIILEFSDTNIISPYILMMTGSEIGDTMTIMSGVRPGISLYTGGKDSLKKLGRFMRILRKNIEEGDGNGKDIQF